MLDGEAGYLRGMSDPRLLPFEVHAALMAEGKVEDAFLQTPHLAIYSQPGPSKDGGAPLVFALVLGTRFRAHGASEAEARVALLAEILEYATKRRAEFLELVPALERIYAEQSAATRGGPRG